MDCVFCQIVAGKIPGEIIYQDKEVIAFRDINPVAPTHLLIVPKKHILTIANVSEADMPLIGQMVKIANQLAIEQGVAESGYRLVINCGQQGGQVVPHLYMHLLGGRQLSPGMG